MFQSHPLDIAGIKNQCTLSFNACSSKTPNNEFFHGRNFLISNDYWKNYWKN